MTKKILYYIASIAISLGSIYLFYIYIDWNMAMSVLQRCDINILGYAFLFFILNYLFRTYRTIVLCNNSPYKYSTIYGITCLHGLFNYMLPVRIGELSYPVLLKTHLKLNLKYGAVFLIINRYFDFSIIALFLPVVIISTIDILPSYLVDLSLFISFFILLSFLGLPKLIFLVNTATKNSDNIFFNSVAKIVGVLQGISKTGQYNKLFLVTVMIWLCIYCNFYLVVVALGFSPTLTQMMLVSTIAVPLSLLPAQGFANLGSHELAWVVGLSFFGYDTEQSLIIAFNTHIILVLFVLLLNLPSSFFLLKGKA